MGLGDVADGLVRGAEGLSAYVSEALFEPVIRLGVTGLARSGKTVFITSLVANLLERERMGGLRAAASGAILAAHLRPQPDPAVPRFDYEAHLDALTGPEPRWPDSTRAVSELRLSLLVRPGGFLGGFRAPRRIHIDIVDYPGEWLLDLGLMAESYAVWSARVLERLRSRPGGAAYLARSVAADPLADFDEAAARGLAEAYKSALHEGREAGHADGTPGRFLMPGELAGSPVLTFAPLALSAAGGAAAGRGRPGRHSLWREMERRFAAYKRHVVRPFFRDHFARIDRQIVLVDALGAIHAGPRAVEDLRRDMALVLAAFRPGRAGWLATLLGARRVDRILFAATKADHLHHRQHGRLSAIMEAMLAEARARSDFAGARTAAMAIASLRATVEEEVMHDGKRLPCVRGRLTDGRYAAFHPGDLPEDPAAILSPARQGAGKWLDGDFAAMRFAPAPGPRRPGSGPPHIRLDRAAEFLFGDRL